MAEIKQVRLSEFTISEIRRIGTEISSSMDDVTVRHLIASYELCKARSMYGTLTQTLVSSEQEEAKQRELVHRFKN
jgi:hypothetical protein